MPFFRVSTMASVEQSAGHTTIATRIIKSRLMGMREDLPQKGMPAGVQVPLVEQRRREGPRSSKPGSHS